MSFLLINGGKRLQGKIRIDGAKNACLPIMAASLLCEDAVTVEDVPDLEDVRIMAQVLNSLGAECYFTGKSKEVKVNSAKLIGCYPPIQMVRQMRASILVLGPLLARLGKACVSLPGGCAIGIRPIDLHLKGLQKMGAEFELENGCVIGKCRQLKGEKIYLDYPSVGATENIMIAAATAKGVTVIENAAKEPEIVDLAGFLNAMGAKISGAGTSDIKVRGVGKLGGGSYQIIPDRIEAGTYLIAAAITGGKVLIENVVEAHLNSVLAKLRDAGCRIISQQEESLLIDVPEQLRAINLKTLPYPGFPTDLQAPMMAMLSVAQGVSVITETVFENRFMHAEEMRRMGADIRIEGRSALLTGKEELNAAELSATDLRAGAALILAALAAKGKSKIHNVYHIDRGYYRMEEKLAGVGADILRLTGKSLFCTRDLQKNG